MAQKPKNVSALRFRYIECSLVAFGEPTMISFRSSSFMRARFTEWATTGRSIVRKRYSNLTFGMEAVAATVSAETLAGRTVIALQSKNAVCSLRPETPAPRSHTKRASQTIAHLVIVADSPCHETSGAGRGTGASAFHYIGMGWQKARL